MDLYNIPGDKGHPFRLQKFLEYQHFAPAVDPIVLTSYMDRKGLSLDDRVLLSWYHSVTYCEVTAIWLLEALDFYSMSKEELSNFWEKYKPVMIFGSARRYAKNMDWFVPLMSKFRKVTKGKPYTWLKRVTGESGSENYTTLYNTLGSWKYMGRFSIDLFIEELFYSYDNDLLDVPIEYPEFNWKSCSNLTSGLMNIMYLDEEANEFDKTNKVLVPEEVLNKKIRQLYKKVQNNYPEKINIMSVTGKLCSFRNLFKGTRYCGFHHDRELGNLIHYQKELSDWEEVWSNIYSIRKDKFPDFMLGELGGWTGIRPERKKLFLTKGVLGIE